MRAYMMIFALALSGGALASQSEDQTQALTQEGLALIPPFQQALLTAVKTAMAQGGPVAAVQACQLQAPQITAAHSQVPWLVGRTSLKVRNPANAPDAWERQVLEQFAARTAKGEALEGMVQVEVVGDELRLMKAIPTGQPCLACHGQKLEPALVTVLDERYPQDAARGFALGELRGAFSLRRSLVDNDEANQ